MHMERNPANSLLQTLSKIYVGGSIILHKKIYDAR